MEPIPAHMPTRFNKVATILSKILKIQTNLMGFKLIYSKSSTLFNHISITFLLVSGSYKLNLMFSHNEYKGK